MKEQFLEYLNAIESYFIERNNNHFIFRNFILNSINKFQDTLKAQFDQYTEDDLENDESHFSSLLIDFHVYYPNNVEYLSVLQLYTNLELTLKSLCDSINQFEQNKLKYKDFKGDNTIDSFRKYLIYSYDFDIKELIDWNLIDEFRLIRNIIAHSNGFVDEDNQKLIKTINDNGLFSIDKVTKQIMINSDYPLYTTNALNDIVKSIVAQIKQSLI